MGKQKLRFVLFLSPIAIFIILFENLLIRMPNNYELKWGGFSKKASKIEVLILGSSHAYYGIDPNHFTFKAFNLANVSQSLDIDAELLTKEVNALPKLRYVVLPISYFSLKSRLAQGSEKWRMPYYYTYYNLPIPIISFLKGEPCLLVQSDDFSSLFYTVIAYYLQGENELKITDDSLGFYSYRDSKGRKVDFLADGLEAVKRHSKKISSPDEQYPQLLKIVKITQQHNIKLVILIPPASKYYYSHLPEAEISRIRSKLEELQENYAHIRYFDFLEDSTYSINDFQDSDHLNVIGAEKFSKKINSILSEIQ